MIKQQEKKECLDSNWAENDDIQSHHLNIFVRSVEPLPINPR